MSDEIATSEGGRSVGIDVLGSHYPFVTPPLEARGVLSDAWFAYPAGAATAPVYVTELRNFARPLGRQPGPAEGEHMCDMVLVDATDAVVFDTRNATYYVGRAFGTRFYVHEWRSGGLILAVTQHTEVALPPDGRRRIEDGDIRQVEEGDDRLIEGEAPPWPAVISTHAQLDERAIEETPGRVFSVQVGDVVLSGDIVFKEGYNVRLTAGTTTSLAPSPLGELISQEGALNLDSFLRIEAAAGAGMGAAPGCPSTETGVLSLGGAVPDQYGRITISADGCLYLTQPAIPGVSSTLIPDTLQLGNHCTTCIDCGVTDGREADIIPAYNVIKSMHTRLDVLGELLETLRLQYIENINDWQAAYDCRLGAKLTIQAIASLVVGDGGSGAATISVLVSIVNTTDACIPGVDVTVTNTLTATRTTDGILPGSAWIVNDSGTVQALAVGASNSEQTFSFGQIRPNRGSSAQYVLYWKREADPPDDPGAAGEPLPSGTFNVCISEALVDDEDLIDDPICETGVTL